jgi:peptidoglycan hydrolase CwlO-like protein
LNKIDNLETDINDYINRINVKEVKIKKLNEDFKKLEEEILKLKKVIEKNNNIIMESNDKIK